MTFEIKYTDSQIEQLIKLFGEGIGESLKNKISSKNKQLSQLGDTSQQRASNIFYKCIGADDVFMPYLRFSFNSKEFRAFFVSIKNQQVFILYDVKQKNSEKKHNQEQEFLEWFRENPNQAYNQAKSIWGVMDD